MTLDPSLLEILACPGADHGELRLDATAQTLTCVTCSRVYPIRDGVPVLLLDEAVQAGSADTTSDRGTAPDRDTASDRPA